jgi:hypothetical protein
MSVSSALVASGTASHVMTATTTLSTPKSPPPTRLRSPAQAFASESVGLTPYMQANTTFVFQRKAGAKPRIAKFADCDNITKLFNHARTASLFRTWAEAAPLSCKVNAAMDEICVMKDVAEDFDQVIEAIQADDCWNNESGECAVSVVLAE